MPKYPGSKTTEPGPLRPFNWKMELRLARDRAIRQKLAKDAKGRLTVGGNRL